jgi:serine protease Do
MVRRFFLSLVLIVAGFMAGLVVTGRMRTSADTRAATPQTDPATAQQRTAPAPAAPAAAALPPVSGLGGPDFTRVAGQAVRGVANISSVQVVRRQNSPLDDPFFRYFFGDSDDMFGGRDSRSLSLGSGVIISADGYVVTNSHVVGENVREITVALGDKREIAGRVIGMDPATDIALLKLNVAGLPVVPWGDSDRLQVGEWVLAIGSPFQLSQTVTAGIVSATRRSNVGFAEYEDFIQTDAAINPGNSGGALINGRGELVGINTGIFSQSGGYQGIGFAVPSNLVKHVIDDLRRYGAVRRGSMGAVAFERLTPRIAEELGVPNTEGAVVVRMQRNSQAYQSGIRPGDVIVAFNAQRISDPAQLSRLLADAPIGSTATIRLMREGRALDVRVPIVSTTSADRR